MSETVQETISKMIEMLQELSDNSAEDEPTEDSLAEPDVASPLAPQAEADPAPAAEVPPVQPPVAAPVASEAPQPGTVAPMAAPVAATGAEMVTPEQVAKIVQEQVAAAVAAMPRRPAASARASNPSLNLSRMTDAEIAKQYNRDGGIRDQIKSGKEKVITAEERFGVMQ